MSDERRADTIRVIMCDADQGGEVIAVRLNRPEAVEVCRMLWRFLTVEERKQVRQP